MDLHDFLQLASSHGPGMCPVAREFLADMLTPTTAFLRLRARGRPVFLLESVEGGDRIGRYSFLATDPLLRIHATGSRVTIEDGDGSVLRTEDGSFFEVFEREMAALRSRSARDLPPFTGGAVGYVAYDAIRYIEKIPDRHPRDDDLPDALFHVFDTVVAFDRAHHRLLLITNVQLSGERRPSRGELERHYAAAQLRLDDLEDALLRPVADETTPARLRALAPLSIDEGMKSNFSRGDFETAVRRAKDHIAAGDAFQIVLSQCFERRIAVDPFEAYRYLRALNPSPYLFFLQWDDAALLGSSPEILVKVEGRTVSVRPIAGTRPRGASPDEDDRLEHDLLEDEKELAEHRMLVDLGRNDVGRVARFGTVELVKYMTIERYSHVMHIVSEVRGELRDGTNALDAFKAGFPAGTVSGAPKIRAMEIIDSLEASRRGIYAGAVGYLDFAGNLDTCIAIRTIVCKNGRARIQAGAGIVADSVPEREYMETVHKATALFEAIRMAEAAGESDGS